MDTVVQERLSTKIQKAVRKTMKYIVDEHDVRARRFLPRNDLESILNKKRLEQLFRELLSNEYASDTATAIPTGSDTGSAEGHDSSIEIDSAVDTCVKATIGTGNVSRRALLALFLYQPHTRLLSLYVEWLTSGHPRIRKPSYDDHEIPCDKSIPFTEGDLETLNIPFTNHGYIMDYQTIFTPMTIRKFTHHDFKTRDRLPFLGAKEKIKDGSSGTVYKTNIAPGHWEFKTSDGRFLPENPDTSMVVALKIFKTIEGPWGTRDAKEVETDFNIERELLDSLRKRNISHRMIMLHWGSFSVRDADGIPSYHALIFELATFSLEAFLKDEECYRIFTDKSPVLAGLVDIVEALHCLHEHLGFFHLDIKPENILVFVEPESVHSGSNHEEGRKLIWKLSDFGLAREKGSTRERTGHRLSSSYYSSQPSTLPATRPAGLYQAPEIQSSSSSQAGPGSDVWSMGCVILMVLASIIEGPEGVTDLSSKLEVFFLNAAGKQKLFYVRNDSHSW
ncbi:kinase-like protein, partial [Karstenula rhodostoma CBS 690.94]